MTPVPQSQEWKTKSHKRKIDHSKQAVCENRCLPQKNSSPEEAHNMDNPINSWMWEKPVRVEFLRGKKNQPWGPKEKCGGILIHDIWQIADEQEHQWVCPLHLGILHFPTIGIQ